jgi:hypothetical protein
MSKIPSKRFNRNYEQKSERKVIYIFTEGTETEPNYFESIKKELRLKNIDIHVAGTAYNTLSLIDYILAFKEKNEIETEPVGIDEIWAVFDKDNFDKDFDNAINKAEAHNIKVAYSNEAFELWFLLHFCYMDNSLTRDIYCKKLNENLKKPSDNTPIKYNKSSKEIYSLIKHLEPQAIKNAEKLLKSFESERSFLKKNPSTTVHLLVCSLKKLKD